MNERFSDSIFGAGKPYFVGCNYWASHAGTNMWRNWDEASVEADLRALSENGVEVIRAFPLWPDFQPLTRLLSNGGSELRRGDTPLDRTTPEGLAGVDAQMMHRFEELLSIAVPITLGSAGLQIINLFDTMIYMRRLTGALAWSSDAADTAKGIYNFCQTIFNLPCSLITPITISIIPTVTAALTKGNTAGARHTEESAVRTMSLIAMPCAVGLAVLSEPIIRLLARNYGPESVATAAPILAYLGIAVIFNSTVLLFNAIMQAHGDVTTPVVNMLIGGVVKVVVNYILVAIPSLNIIGAAIGTIVCYVTITVLDLIAMRRSVTTRPAIFRNVIRPAAAAGIMGAATFFAAALLRSFTDSNTVVCLGALIAAVVVYVIFVVVLRCITYEDCMLLPKGEKIAKILHIKQKT